MKNVMLLLALCLSSVMASSQQDVTMKITYNGNPVCKYEVTMKTGGATLGVGTTDNQGEVVFPGVLLITRNVDVYAHKGGAADKHFEVQGWVVINEDFTYELKMEDLLNEIAGGSGMPPSMFADSWGLTSLDCN